MRVLVFFDLPTISTSDKKAYRDFRKLLLKNGYMMLQESVYIKLVMNAINAELAVDFLRKNKPHEGHVMVMTITEKQFSKMEVLVGSMNTEVINTTERIIVL